MRTETYFIIDGRITIYKTPAATLVYGIDLADWIDEVGSPLSDVSATVRGVTLVGEPFIQDAKVCAWIQGLDESEGAVNSCTFEFQCADGVTKDSRTLYFIKRRGGIPA